MTLTCEQCGVELVEDDEKETGWCSSCAAQDVRDADEHDRAGDR